MHLLIVGLFAATAQADEILHNHARVCPEQSALAPGPGEERFIAVTRLTAVQTPLAVHTVRAKLHHGEIDPVTRCDASGAHRLQVWVGTDEQPVATPELQRVLTFGEEEVLGDERVLSARMEEPLTLNAGQYLFVSVDFGGEHPRVGCVATCRTGTKDAAFWSNTPGTPYDWRSLTSFGVQADLWIEAIGSPAM